MHAPPEYPGTAKPHEGLDGVLRAYMDVTERLRQTHDRLHHEVARLRAELELKDRELESRRRLAALGELAAGVAHEVRNPLGAIQLYSELLRNECGELSSALRLIDKIEAGVRAIDGVVQDTLSLAPSRPEACPRALRPIVEASVELCCAKLEQRQVRVVTTFDSDDVCVFAEPDGLKRVLMNLLVNAAEAAPPESRIDLTVKSPQDGCVRIIVADRGCGLPPELIDRIFDPFFTTKNHGTGLGLTLAHRLMEAYGGELRAANREEGGAEFTIVLRVATEEAEDHPSTGTPRRFSAA